MGDIKGRHRKGYIYKRNGIWQLEYIVDGKRFKRWMTADHPSVRNLRDVTAEIAEEYSRDLSRGYSPNSFNKHVQLLALVFRLLLGAGGPETTVWHKDTIPRNENLKTQSRRELTVDEVDRLISSAPGELKLLFLLGAYTGIWFSSRGK